MPMSYHSNSWLSSFQSLKERFSLLSLTRSDPFRRCPSRYARYLGERAFPVVWRLPFSQMTKILEDWETYVGGFYFNLEKVLYVRYMVAKDRHAFQLVK
jgi:hypothetical protein